MRIPPVNLSMLMRVNQYNLHLTEIYIHLFSYLIFSEFVIRIAFKTEAKPSLISIHDIIFFKKILQRFTQILG